jgi:hypothetical protein
MLNQSHQLFNICNISKQYICHLKKKLDKILMLFDIFYLLIISIIIIFFSIEIFFLNEIILMIRIFYSKLFLF